MLNPAASLKTSANRPKNLNKKLSPAIMRYATITQKAADAKSGKQTARESANKHPSINVSTATAMIEGEESNHQSLFAKKSSRKSSVIITPYGDDLPKVKKQP